MGTVVRGLASQNLSDAVYAELRAGNGALIHEVATLADLAIYIGERFPETTLLRRSLGRGTFTMTGAQILDEVRAVSIGLTHLGVEPGDRVAIIADSRPEWVIADLAAISAGAITVPVYPTQSAGHVEFILADCGAKVAVLAGAAQLEKVRRISDRLPRLELLLVIDPPGPNEPSFPDALPLAEVARQGRSVLEADPEASTSFLLRASSCDEQAIATIVYTMDESGDAKGAMLTHANLLANVRATEEILPLDRDDIALSLLPLSHVFERMALYRYLRDGVETVFVESLMTVMRDLKRVRPTVMTGVPRGYEKVLGAVEEELARAPRWRRALVVRALALARKRAVLVAAGRRVPRDVALAHAVVDRLVLARLRRATGGRLRCLVCGSARLPERVRDFFAAVGLPLFEGYGLTETSPVLTTNGPGQVRPGTVGRPLPGVEIRIADDGEILARGPNITRGYLNREDLTLQAFAGGWFHTGDIGSLDQDGYLTISDRRKNLIVTAGGKKIAPAPLEARLRGNPLVADAIVIGENRKFPSVLIVPDLPALEAHLASIGAPPPASGNPLERADVLQVYQKLVDELNRDLAQFERIKRFALLPPGTALPAAGPSMTMMRRREVIEHEWQPIVDRLYSSGRRDSEA